MVFLYQKISTDHKLELKTITKKSLHWFLIFLMWEIIVCYIRACLHGVGDPGLVELVSFVFTLWGTQNKTNLPH